MSRVGDPSIGPDGVERRQAEGDDLVAVQRDDVAVGSPVTTVLPSCTDMSVISSGTLWSGEFREGDEQLHRRGCRRAGAVGGPGVPPDPRRHRRGAPAAGSPARREGAQRLAGAGAHPDPRRAEAADAGEARGHLPPARAPSSPGSTSPTRPGSPRSAWSSRAWRRRWPPSGRRRTTARYCWSCSTTWSAAATSAPITPSSTPGCTGRSTPPPATSSSRPPSTSTPTWPCASGTSACRSSWQATSTSAASARSSRPSCAGMRSPRGSAAEQHLRGFSQEVRSTVLAMPRLSSRGQRATLCITCLVRE